MRLEHTHTGLSGTPRHARSVDASENTAEPADSAALGQEVCPLCLARYEAQLECICVACEAPSCPDCAAPMPGTDTMLCYACPVPTKH